MEKYVCATCGSDNVESLVWIKANTNAIIGPGQGDPQGNWCCECNEHCSIILKEQDEVQALPG